MAAFSHRKTVADQNEINEEYLKRVRTNWIEPFTNALEAEQQEVKKKLKTMRIEDVSVNFLQEEAVPIKCEFLFDDTDENGMKLRIGTLIRIKKKNFSRDEPVWKRCATVYKLPEIGDSRCHARFNYKVEPPPGDDNKFSIKLHYDDSVPKRIIKSMGRFVCLPYAKANIDPAIHILMYKPNRNKNQNMHPLAKSYASRSHIPLSEFKDDDIPVTPDTEALYKRVANESQITACKFILGHRISPIQGPPGMGKTVTGGVATFTVYYNSDETATRAACEQAAAKVQTGPTGASSSVVDKKPKILKPSLLLCASSNVATNNLAEKVLQFFPTYFKEEQPHVQPEEYEFEDSESESDEEQDTDNEETDDEGTGGDETTDEPSEGDETTGERTDETEEDEGQLSDDEESICDEGYGEQPSHEPDLNIVRVFSKSQQVGGVPSVLQSIALHLKRDEIINRKIQQRNRKYLQFERRSRRALEEEDRNIRKKLERKCAKFILRVERRILNIADIIICTTAVAGSKQIHARAMLKHKPFEMGLIDEASQCMIPESLMVINLRCNRVVLIGDVKQLPPTVVSKNGADVLKLSILQQINNNGIVSAKLKKQYRMHPWLSKIPIMFFYEKGTLFDGVTSVDRHVFEMDGFWDQRFKSPTWFIADECPETENSRHSYKNEGQANKVVQIVRQIFDRINNGNYPETAHRIGVISPYEAQRQLARVKLNNNAMHEIEVANIDAFQGREKDFIVLTTVQCNGTSETGFISDERRINVALTRARCGLVIIGHPQTLTRSGYWYSIMKEYTEYGLLVDMDEQGNTKYYDNYNDFHPCDSCRIRYHCDTDCPTKTMWITNAQYRWIKNNGDWEGNVFGQIRRNLGLMCDGRTEPSQHLVFSARASIQGLIPKEKRENIRKAMRMMEIALREGINDYDALRALV